MASTQADLIAPQFTNAWQAYIVGVNRMRQIGNNQIVFRFPNDYGASVIRGPYSYGGADGLFELAVLKWDGNKSELCYTTPITNDVIGHATSEDIDNLLTQIMALPSEP